LLRGDGAEFGKGCAGVSDVGGFAAFAAVGLWSEVGAVGFDEEAVQWNRNGGVTEFDELGPGTVLTKLAQRIRRARA